MCCATLQLKNFDDDDEKSCLVARKWNGDFPRDLQLKVPQDHQCGKFETSTESIETAHNSAGVG
jgi:hypothetical protein